MLGLRICFMEASFLENGFPKMLTLQEVEFMGSGLFENLRSRLMNFLESDFLGNYLQGKLQILLDSWLYGKDIFGMLISLRVNALRSFEGKLGSEEMVSLGREINFLGFWFLLGKLVSRGEATFPTGSFLGNLFRAELVSQEAIFFLN